MEMENRKWYLRKSRNGGYDYLWYRYSNTRIVKIVHNPIQPDCYIVETRFCGKGHKPNARLINPDTKTENFDTLDAAFDAANAMIEQWMTPNGMLDNRVVNPAFEDFAAKHSIDYLSNN